MLGKSPLIFPAEWTPHSAIWTGWPSNRDLWKSEIDRAREQIAAMIGAIVMPDNGETDLRGEQVNLLVRDQATRDNAMSALGSLIDAGLVTLIEMPIGDIWLRDTAPLFSFQNDVLRPVVFGFNGWGGKFNTPSDDKIAGLIADHVGLDPVIAAMVLEGGSIDVDGQGTALTTRQCLLNKNRNPNLSQSDIEKILRESLGITHLIWLDDGLINDHTDGHVDNIARFIAPGKVVCMHPTGDDDPNAAVYDDIRRALSRAHGADGQPLEVIELPSPGLVNGHDGQPVPASHMNFLIANEAVILPVYAKTDIQIDAVEETLDILADHIERDHFHALEADAVLTGGGSFHCITQQQPAPRS